MSALKQRIAFGVALVALLAALLFLGQARIHSESVQQTLERMDHDVAAAKAAADRAAASAAEARDSAHKAWNGLPGSS